MEETETTTTVDENSKNALTVGGLAVAGFAIVGVITVGKRALGKAKEIRHNRKVVAQINTIPTPAPVAE